jgi:hypothetical protein
MLNVAPWSQDGADTLVASVESAILAQLRGTTADQGVIDAVPASFQSADRDCVPLFR